MFSLVCLCPQGDESHVTITHGALDLVVQGTSPPPDMGPYWTGTPSNIWWPSLDPFSNLFTSSPSPLPSWHLVAVVIEVCMVSTSGQYASYWNAFLYHIITYSNNLKYLAQCSLKQILLCRQLSYSWKRTVIHSAKWHTDSRPNKILKVFEAKDLNLAVSRLTLQKYNHKLTHQNGLQIYSDM